MVSINRKLVVAGAAGFVLAVIMFLIGSITLSVIPTFPSVTPLAAAGIGFGGAVAATLSEDLSNGDNKPKQ
jgi:hypothetical protein